MKLVLDYKITTILLIGLILRIISIYFYRDIEIVNEWGIIVKNLEENNILSVHSVQGVPVPNIFMPPLYPLFLYSIKTFFSNTDIFLWAIYYAYVFIRYSKTINGATTLSTDTALSTDKFNVVFKSSGLNSTASVTNLKL